LVSSLLLNPFSMTAVLMKSIKQKDRANGGFDFQEANCLFLLLHWAEGRLFSLQCASSHQIKCQANKSYGTKGSPSWKPYRRHRWRYP
jgi:hypothetical protein